jgi:hypothetical protein
MEESDEVLKWRPTTSKNIGDQRTRTESLKWLGLEEEEGERVYISVPIVPVCGSNPDYRWASNPGWIHQPVLKL